jgi:hypothetical protein
MARDGGSQKWWPNNRQSWWWLEMVVADNGGRESLTTIGRNEPHNRSNNLAQTMSKNRTNYMGHILGLAWADKWSSNG